jgi:hypothetical protein
VTFVARAAVGMVLVCTAIVLWAFGGLVAIGCFLLIALGTLPGIPLGFTLFGRHHAAGWIAGALFGYAITALACWAVVFFRFPSFAAFAVVWFGACAASWAAFGRRSTPAVTLPAWSARDTAALALLVLLVPALVGPPFARLGSQDASGNRRYRAYFIADFVWHTALTAELAKHDQPPRNPFLASQPIHYYWTYFLVPARVASDAHVDVQLTLKVTAVLAALLFVSAIFLAAWAALPLHPFAVAVGTALTILAPSIEGLAATVDLLRRGHPLSELRELNIDAIASWAFKGLRVDDLPRSMWYNPQHSTACALGLLALPVAIGAGARASMQAIVLAGLALGASVAFNPFVGMMLSAVYAAGVLLDATRTRAGLRVVLRHAAAAAPVAIALAWCSLNQVAEGAGGALHFGPFGPARNAPLITFLLSFGPLLIAFAVGCWPSPRVPFAPLRASLVGIGLSVFLMFFLTLTVDLFWVGFRTGQIIFILAPAVVARAFALLWRVRLPIVAIGLAVVVLALGLPTTAIDAFNAQDVTNLAMGPGFHWTVSITPAEQEAFDWIKRNTAPDAIVQAEPIVRGRETWSLVPTFAERRMAAGQPIALLNIPEYTTGSEQVRQIYAGDDPLSARRLAQQLGIDYLFVGTAERAAYPAVAKFDAHPELFSRVFRNRDVSIYAIR